MAIDLCTLLVDWYTATLTMENAELTNWTSIITAGAVVAAPLGYVIKRWWTSNTLRKEISHSLHEELKDCMEAIDENTRREVKEIIIEGEKKYYTLTFMNHDMYDSLIFSGKIQAVNIHLQQKIQDIFRKIKLHHQYLEYVTKLRDDAKLNDVDIDETTLPYYGMLADYELEVLESIPTVMKELEKNF